MAQRSHAYASGRVRVLSAGLLNQAAIERVAASPTLADAARALTELGWGEVRTKRDMEDAARKHMAEACALVREISPEPDVTNSFLIRYDALNLKMLVKARSLKMPLENLPLSGYGALDAERLRRAVDENKYADLPAELKEAMERIEKKIAGAMDPLYVDAELDKAAALYAENHTRGVKNETVRQYFICRAETTNLLIALRAHAMGRGGAFAQALFVPGGTLGADALIAVSGEPEKAFDLIRNRPYAGALSGALKPSPDAAAAEKAAQDYLISLFYPHRNEVTSVLPLLYFLLARERESGDVRLIATGKSAGVSEDEIIKRLRAVS